MSLATRALPPALHELMCSKSPRKQRPHPSPPDGPTPSLESAEGAAGVLDILANELVLLLLMESGILATINAGSSCRRLRTLARVAHGQQELVVRACDDTLACALYVARCGLSVQPCARNPPPPSPIAPSAFPPHNLPHTRPLLFCRLPSVQTLRVESAPGRFELLALAKLRTPPGLRGKHSEPQPTEADAMPPPPSPSAVTKAGAAPPAPPAPRSSQLHRVRLAWTDGAGVPRVLGPLPAFYLGAALASSVRSVPGCSLARTDTERPCLCAWSTTAKP